MHPKGHQLVVFGNSPFIDRVDVEALCKRYTTVGINTFGRTYQVDYSFVYDRYVDGLKPCQLFLPHWMKEEGTKYVPRASSKPFTPAGYQNSFLRLGFCYYTVSLVLNWAILGSYRTIYLVGVDHNESDMAFKHWSGYGQEYPSELVPSSHQRLKEFVYSCAQYADIYQTNPDTDWKLPYKDLKELYGKTA